MPRDALDRWIDAITTHNRIVIVVLLLMTAGMVMGIGNLDTSNQASSGDVGETTPAQKAEYIADNYDDPGDESNVSASPVYLRHEGGNALSKDALIESLEYQRTVLDNESVSASLPDDEGVTGVANVVGARAARDANATLDEQIAALESTDDDEYEALLEATLTEESGALSLLPASYEPGSTTAESHRMVFRFETDGTDDSAGFRATHSGPFTMRRPSTTSRTTSRSATTRSPTSTSRWSRTRRRSFCRSRWRSFSASPRSPTAISSTSSSA